MEDSFSWLLIDGRRRALAFLVGLACACALVAALTFGPVWALYSKIPPAALRTDRLRVTHELVTKWQSGAPNLLLVGGSQLREAVPVSTFVSRHVGAICGRDLEVLNASSSSQPVEASAAIGNWFVGDRPDVVVVSVNLWRAAEEAGSAQQRGRARFSLPQSRATEGFGARSLPQTAALARERLGITFMDVLNALGIGVPVPQARSGPFLEAQHQYRRRLGDAQEVFFEAHYMRLMADQMSDARWAAEIATYRELALQLMARGSRVAYFIAPEPPAVRALLAPHDARVRAALSSLPGASSLTLLDLRHAPEVSDADFADASHLLESGRRAIWPRVSDWLVDLHECARGRSIQ